MSNIPAHPNEQLPLGKKLDDIGAGQSTPRNPSEGDEAYAERLIDAIDATVNNLWNLQDEICTLLIETDSAA